MEQCHIHSAIPIASELIKYKNNFTEVAAFMGHSVPVHNFTYAQWSTESMLESSMDRAIKFRDLTVE